MPARYHEPCHPRELARWRRRLLCRWPVLGRFVRRQALARLRERRDHPMVIPLLTTALVHDDRLVAHGAREALRTLEGPAAIDALCELAMGDPAGPTARLCVTTGKRPSDPERACLFLFVTRQLDAYFDEDFEFQNLRLEYDRADADLRRRVLAVLRSGDPRCLPFFTTRKQLSECTETEILFALRSFIKHRDWSRLFRAFLELPLRHGLRILHDLGRSSWEPEDPEQRSLYRQVLSDSRGALPPVPSARTPAGPVFERWLSRGLEEAMTRKSVDELLAELGRATPFEGVAITAALAERCAAGSEAARTVEAHPHWLVRLAGYHTGLVVNVLSDRVEDPVHWLRWIAPEYPLLELPPGHATPALLDALISAPPSVWEGPLGIARRVFQTIVGHRLTVGSFEKMVVEVDAFAGEFEALDTDEVSVTLPQEIRE